jgi:hypothetical protein
MNSSVAMDTDPRGASPSSRSEYPIGHAWVAIGAFVFITIAGTFGAAKLMNYVYPASSFVLLLFLYHRYPLFFHSFIWWLIFLSPLVRRLVDYRSSFTNPSPILIAPSLVGIIILPSFLKQIPSLKLRDAVPYGMAAFGVCYGFIMSYFYNIPMQKVLLGTMGWLSPIFYGFYVFIHWRQYPEYQKNLEQTMRWGILIMSVYGIYQYLNLPEWDRAWMVNSAMNVAGDAATGEVRVWSTMNSGEPFSALLAAGLIITLGGKGMLPVAASATGYITFLLSLIRSAWLGWIGGIFCLFFISKPQFQGRLIFSTLALSSLITPLVASGVFGDRINTRFSTFSDLGNDASANGRQSMYSEIDTILTNFLGGGIQDARMDSSIFSLLVELGWVGGIPYVLGLGGLIYACWVGVNKPYASHTSKLMLAAAVTCLVRIPVNTTLTGIGGTLLWGSLSFCLAGSKYLQHQRIRNNPNLIQNGPSL